MVGELGESLHACVTRPDEDEGHEPRPRFLVERSVGCLELLEDMVAQVDRIGERLEGEPVLGEAGNRERPRHGAERDDEVPPAHRPAADRRCTSLEIEALCPREQEVGVWAHRAERHDGMPRLERSRRRLGKEWRVEHEVLGTDDRRAAAAKESRDVSACEAAADDEHVALF